MATYQSAGGENIQVGSPELNPSLTTGKTLISQGDNLSAPPISTTFDANRIQNGNSLSLLPTPAPSTNGISSNTSIPSPTIPTAESVISQNAQNTPAQTQQNSILQRIAALVGGGQTQTTLTNASESQAGVPQLTKTVNDLNTQLQGLNDQATGLQNEAQFTIPNQAQQDATGRGITAGGLAPITASQLRVNQIKQGAIATQALTVKAALYGAQGNLTLAKDAADKAATAQYEQQQQQIDYQKAQLAALTPTLTKDEKNQAAIVQAQLADRQRAIDTAKEDKKSIIAMATAALNNFPNDPAAHYAAQQALAESNKEQPNLQAALSLVGQYQKDPIATQQAIANLAKTRAETEKTNKDLANTTSRNNVSTVSGSNVVAGKTVDPAIASDVEAVLSGRNTLYNIKQTMGRTNSAAAYMKQMRDTITSIDPKFDFIASDAGGKSVSTGYVQKSTAAINSVLPNINKIIDLSNQVPRVGITGVDNLIQKGGLIINDQKVANFHEAQKLIADEIGVALGAGTVSDMKLQLGFDVTDPTVSQETFASNMGVIKEFITNRLAGLNSLRYSSSVTGGTGTPSSSGASSVSDTDIANLRSKYNY